MIKAYIVLTYHPLSPFKLFYISLGVKDVRREGKRETEAKGRTWCIVKSHCEAFAKKEVKISSFLPRTKEQLTRRAPSSDHKL